MRIIERNVQEIGSSLLITLPKDWAKQFNIKKASKLKILIHDDANLSIRPEFIKQEIQEKSITIPFDNNFKRHFFRAYFYAHQKITFTFSKSPKLNERKDLYMFLEKFMNVQIIDETKEKIVLKVFKIEELSSEDCLKRMFYLTLNLFDDTMNAEDHIKIMHTKQSSQKFYYLLTMQIRRFLDEGKYTKDKSMTLIRAVDIRMAAEKVARASYILSQQKIQDKKLHKELQNVKELFSKAGLAFINSNFAAGVQAQRKIIDQIKKCKKSQEQTKSISIYKQLEQIHQILQYSKELSSLIR